MNKIMTRFCESWHGSWKHRSPIGKTKGPSLLSEGKKYPKKSQQFAKH